ncbi:MAG: GDSL-type esterase/lipase family protein, partial [Verrucomicrobiota bacterium]|nr:GDSL-type esterase/lipase family protein [Verrucomicrobiota bacterium]
MQLGKLRYVRLRDPFSLRMGKLTYRTLRAFLPLLLLATVTRAQTNAVTPVPTKTVVFLGDSLSAGLGVKPEEAFPALVQQKIRADNLPYEVVNAGLSGDTSAGGLRRADWLMQRPVDVLVLELGGNDGLRGLPIANLKANLQAIIDKVKAKNPAVQIVIAGIQMPPNVGADYAEQFRTAFA